MSIIEINQSKQVLGVVKTMQTRKCFGEALALIMSNRPVIQQSPIVGGN